MKQTYYVILRNKRIIQPRSYDFYLKKDSTIGDCSKIYCEFEADSEGHAVAIFHSIIKFESDLPVYIEFYKSHW